jgi:hypothetical protein
MTIEEFLQNINQDRIKREERMIRKLLAEYRRMDRGLAKVYTAFGKEEEKGRGGEGENHPGAGAPPLARHEGSSEGLAKRKQLKSLLDAVRAEIGKFGKQAAAIIEQGQREEIKGQREAAKAILKLLGIKEAKIPPGGPENGPGMMGDGSKIADYFSKKLARAVAARVKQAASNSAAAKPGAVISKLKASHGILLGRALTAARTETMRAARETAHGTYEENGITEWTWHSQRSFKTCAFCRSQHGTRHPISEQLLSHPNCRCIAKPVGAAHVNRPADSEQLKDAPAGQPEKKKQVLSSFTGKLKGRDVRLTNVVIRRIKYTKRDPADTEILRRAFDGSKRKDFVKHISGGAENIATLKRAGLSDAQIQKLQSGKVPKGFQVHHKLPLDDGGDNSFSNLVLIKNHPYHKAITNEQNRVTKGLKSGKSRGFDWVIPPGIVYPAGR